MELLDFNLVIIFIQYYNKEKQLLFVRCLAQQQLRF